MTSSKKPPKQARPRFFRRQAEREAIKAVAERRRLAALEPGGSPTRPRPLTSASEVEGDARSTPCAVCGGEVVVVEHRAVAEPERLREAVVACRVCGERRSLWYRLAGANLN